MNARLINTGQVPLYDLSLEAQAEEMEVRLCGKKNRKWKRMEHMQFCKA